MRRDLAFCLALTATVLACGRLGYQAGLPGDEDAGQDSGDSGTDAARDAQSALLISSSSPLIVSRDLGFTSTRRVDPLPVLDAGNPVAGEPQSPTGGAELTGTAADVAVDAAPVQTTDGTAFDATSAASWTIEVSGDFGAGASCTVNPPHDHVPCTLPSFTVERTELRTGGLSIEACEGGTCRTSNTLPTRRFTVRQISDTRQDTSVSDTADGLMALGGVLFFRSNISTDRRYKLFYYEDATGVVTQATQIRGATSTDSITDTLSLSDRLFFLGAESTNSGLYGIQPSGSGFELREFGESSVGGEAASGQLLGPQRDHLYVVLAGDSSRGTFRLDLSSGGLEQLLGRGVGDFAVYRNLPYFASPTPVSSLSELKLHRVTAGGTVERLSMIRREDISDGVHELTVFDDRLVFVGVVPTPEATKLVAYDASSGTIDLLSNTTGDMGDPDDPEHLTVFDGWLYFEADNPNGASKLFRFDGQRIEQISDLTEDATASDAIDRIFVAGGELYVVGAAPPSRALYRYDPVDHALHRLTSISLGTGGPVQMAQYGGSVYVLADDADGNRKVFVLTEEGAVQVTNTNPDGHDLFDETTVVGGKLYFGGHNAQGVRKLMSLCDESTGCTD